MAEKSDWEEYKTPPLCRANGSVQRLLDSFPIRKNAELKEFVRDSKTREKGHPSYDPMAEVFALTR